MKIALIIFHADASRGGAERYTLDLATALAREGHQISLIATSFAKVPDGVVQVELSASGLTRFGSYRRMLDSLDAHLDANSYDIVHAMLPVRRCDVYHPHAGIALAALAQPLIHLRLRRKSMGTVERDLLLGANPPVVLCLSEYVKRTVLRYYPTIERRLATLFNAVDLKRFAPPSRSSHSGVRALFIGQDFERKGLPATLEAMRLMNDPGLSLTVVGRQSTASNDMPARVTFAGETSDPRPFYRDADFFVLPTKHDPCSLVVLEALAMGLPVISTKFNGACEIMADGVHGFVLDDPNDVRALADAMRRLLDPELRMRMSRACLDLRPKLSYENHIRSLTETYERVLQSRDR